MNTVFVDIEQQLDRHGGRYLYKQIKSLLRDKMDARELKPGDTIMPQRELSKLFKVSEVTVRRAIHELVLEGSLSSRPGSGTVVLARGRKAPKPVAGPEATAKVSPTDVGIVFADVSEGYPLFDEFIEGMRSVVGESSLLQFFQQPLAKGGDPATLANRIPLERLAGLVMISPINLELVTRCRREHVPFVMLCSSSADQDSPRVIVDYESGMTDAMVHLRERGRSRIAFISSGPHLYSSRQHTNAYRMGLKWLKIESNERWLIHAGSDELAGYEATKQLLELDERPDAIIYGTDYSAKGGLHAMLHANLRIPQDIAIVGMGNVLREMETPVGITTVDIMIKQEGQSAMQMLAQLIDGQNEISKQIIIPPKLIVREST